jgi:excisionase family DNA binding protein
MPRALSEIRPVPRRGLSRNEAAMYVGISPAKFDQLVADGRMPAARRIDGRKVWDKCELDSSFEDLPHDNGAPAGNSWDDR